jgi:hypothetical protein
LNILFVGFRVRFFLLQNNDLLFLVLNLGLELETTQTFQPPAPLCPPNLAQKDKEWMKVGSK